MTENIPAEYVRTPFRDDWPTLKGNNLRNSQSLLPGAMAARPRILAEARFGNYQGYFLLSPDAKAEKDFVFTSTGASFTDIEKQYEFYGLKHTLENGESFMRHEYQNGRYLSLYEGQVNYLYVTGDYGSSTLLAPNTLQVYRVKSPRMKSDGLPDGELLWEVTMPYYLYRPHIAVADMNNDGVRDIMVEGWEGVVVVDGKTRKLMMDIPTSKLHDARKRGYVMAKDINQDGFPEVIILSSFPWDVNVIANDGKNLDKLWFKIYDNHIESARIITSYTRNPVDDHNGDGRFEMIFNVWNETGDGQWHVKMLDALTGDEVLDIPRTYLHDTVDVNHDGKSELFVSTPNGVDIPEFSTLHVLDISGSVLFAADHAKFGVNYDDIDNEALAVHCNLNHKLGVEYLITGQSGKDTCFYVFTDDNMQTLISRHTLTDRDKNFELIFPHGNNVELIKTTVDQELLMQWESRYESPSGILLKGMVADVLCWAEAENQQIKLPVIGSTGGSANSVIVANGVGQVVCYDYHGGDLAERWSADGYGAADQYQAWIDYGVVMDDFNGDGKNEIAVRVNGKDGAGVRMLDGHGRMLWQRDFPLIPSGKAASFKGLLGFITSAENADGGVNLVVSGQRVVQHTGITYGLDGKTGDQLWMIDVVRKGKKGESGAGSFYLTAFDYNGDGIDEISTGYGNNIWAANARTGEIYFANFMCSLWQDKWLKNDRTGWVSSISPIPVMQKGKATYSFYGNAGDSAGVAWTDLSQPDVSLEDKTHLIWGNMAKDYTDRYHQCVFEYEGKSLVAEPGRKDGRYVIHAIDPMNGNLVGTDYKLPTAAVPIACDMDGDGRQEIVFTTQNAVAAIRFNGSGWDEIWDISLDAPLSWPAYGDVNADGKGEIVVTTASGRLYVIGA
jgi:hypothetical protein